MSPGLLGGSTVYRGAIDGIYLFWRLWLLNTFIL